MKKMSSFVPKGKVSFNASSLMISGIFKSFCHFKIRKPLICFPKMKNIRDKILRYSESYSQVIISLYQSDKANEGV